MLSVWKFHDLIFQRGTVSRTNSLDLPAVQRGPMHVSTHGIVDLGIGLCDVARGSILEFPSRAKRKGSGGSISFLPLKGGEIDAPAIDSGRSPGFEAAPFKAQLTNVVAKHHRSSFAISPSRKLPFTNMDQSV